ncbi:MAG: complex I 51 kDa subunit family protein [Fusobacteriaceae bacterium]
MKKESLIFNIEDGKFIDLKNYLEFKGYESLKKVLGEDTKKNIEEIKNSMLRGRGGAAFPTGLKIEAVSKEKNFSKYVICNADEGEPGTFKDRFILTHNPFLLLEGLTISAFLAGASEGIIYVRHEYPEVQKILKQSIEEALAKNLLGNNILGSNFSFNLKIFSGAGSYLCGEETALLSSIEGKKGRPTLKPPYPTQSGIHGKPTLICNVETLCNIPKIILNSAEWFKNFGTVKSKGTKLISLSGDVKKRGVVEVPFGVTLREIIFDYGCGMTDEGKFLAINIGGASGVLLPENMLDTKLDYDECGTKGVTIGSGAVFVLNDKRSIIKNVHNRVKFFLHESCGKCVPCREGLRQSKKILDDILDSKATLEDIERLKRYTRVIQTASFCGLGQAAGNSLSSSLQYYLEEYRYWCENPMKKEAQV